MIDDTKSKSWNDQLVEWYHKSGKSIVQVQNG